MLSSTRKEGGEDVQMIKCHLGRDDLEDTGDLKNHKHKHMSTIDILCIINTFRVKSLSLSLTGDSRHLS